MATLTTRSRFRAWGLAGLAALVAGLAAGAVWWQATDSGDPGDPGNSASDDPARLAVGRQLYAEACASCHGANLEGQPNWRQRRADGRLPAPPHDETGHTWHHPDGQLFEITKRGVEVLAPEGYESDMPAFAERLSDDQIRAVLAYIKSTWPADIRAEQERRTARARDE